MLVTRVSTSRTTTSVQGVAALCADPGSSSSNSSTGASSPFLDFSVEVTRPCSPLPIRERKRREHVDRWNFAFLLLSSLITITAKATAARSEGYRSSKVFWKVRQREATRSCWLLLHSCTPVPVVSLLSIRTSLKSQRKSILLVA